MRKLSNTTTRSARLKVAATLLGILAVLAVAAYAAGGKADCSVSASPSSQTVSQGQATTYTVTVTRVNGFTGPVTLSAGSLPTGATASWKRSDGTASNVVPPNLNSATLTLQTASRTPQGTYHPVITATAGNLSHTTTLMLVVQPATQPNFTLSGSPASQPVLQGDITSYTVNVNRTGGFSGPVALSVTGLPRGTTAWWSPSSTVPGAGSSTTLQIDTANNTQPDSYSLAITGKGAVSGSTASRSAVVVLVVEKSRSFQIKGNLGAQLAPGAKGPLNLSLTNPYHFDLHITNLAVAVEEGTSRVSCSGTQNFTITQVPARRYPITLPSGQTRTLAQLGVAEGDRPQVAMLDRPWNQDGCRNATISLDYGGSARK